MTNKYSGNYETHHPPVPFIRIKKWLQQIDAATILT